MFRSLVCPWRRVGILALLLGSLTLWGGCASAPSGEEMAGPGLQMRLPEAPDAASVENGEAPAGPGSAGVQGPGGATPSGLAYRLRVGDGVSISFRGIPTPFDVIAEVDENGFIKLQYVDRIKAAGLTSSELEDAIQAAYVPEYYRQMTVTVFIPSQSYYVRGEVTRPGRFPVEGVGVTLLQAIATSGGYTEYANPKRVEILRGGAISRHDLTEIERNPEMDVPVLAGDVVIVRRRFF